jgi:hypothetical protein
LALVGGEWSASLSARFTPGTHWIGGILVAIRRTTIIRIITIITTTKWRRKSREEE